ncbi:MAG TPA: cupin domain-containing protein [Phenylobacterium sp.]|uniref:cupin domain-containing protein n=1 Tax=Phenylobacterium sp. TaxID=1871053 RepID=UPI002BABA042|nr:cupin domain-containing protein [Phenylobacterium sp.]HSV01913.1 cupin domain-containing protein [Phenylobacterium sp.]
MRLPQRPASRHARQTIAILAGAVALAGAAAAQAPPKPVTTTLKTLSATSAGQPIVLPPGPVQATVSETTVPPHGQIAPHKHPYPRYVYVLAGRVRVINLVTGQTYELKAGDMSLDPVDQWHKAEALGDGPARLIALDQTPPGVSNVVRQAP